MKHRGASDIDWGDSVGERYTRFDGLGGREQVGCEGWETGPKTEN